VRRVAPIVLALLVVVPSAGGAQALSVRRAVPADEYPKRTATEWWQVLAFDPGSHRFVRALLIARPWPDFRVEVLRSGESASGLAGGAMALVAQSQPGVAMVGTSPIPGTEPPRASLRYAGGRYVVDVKAGAGDAHLVVVPQRAGPTVGPWRLGRLQTSWNPPAFVPGWRVWSVPVATGRASGWVVVDGRRLELRGWRAYHDHTWGQFSLAASSWVHSDFAVVSPRRGEAWIVNGLEPSNGAYRTDPNDRLWQGVLVHAAGSRVVTCTARVRRSGWHKNPSNGWYYLLPDRVRASCARAGSYVFRPQGGFRGVDGFGVVQEVGGSKPTRGGNGWIAHAMPPVPNS
jgi:hypothetical protein